MYLAVFKILFLEAANGSWFLGPWLLSMTLEVVIVVVVFAVLNGFGLNAGLVGDNIFAADFGRLEGELESEAVDRGPVRKDFEDASWWRRKKKM